MASTGYISHKFTSWDTIKLTWTIASQSVENNTSTVNWKLELIAGEYGALVTSVAKSYSVNINGKWFNGSCDINIGNNQTKTLATGTTTIEHSTLGNKTFSYSFRQNIAVTFNGTYIDTSTASGTGELNVINRASTVTATNGVIGHVTTITINKNNRDFLHTLKYQAFAGGGSTTIIHTETIFTKSIAFSYDWEIPNSLADLEPFKTNKILTGQLVCDTYTSDGKYVGTNRKSFSIEIDAELYKPVLELTVYDNNNTTVALTGESSTFIKYCSSAAYTINAYGVNGATIESYKMTCGNASATYSQGVIYRVTSGTFAAAVTDSRGLETKEELTFNFIDYFNPSCNIEVSTPTTDGTCKIKVSGQCYSGTFGGKYNTQNTVEISYSMLTNDETTPTNVNVTELTPQNNSYSIEFEVTGLNYENAYTFQAFAQDKLRTAQSAQRKVKTTPVFDWGKNDFVFNVPVSIQGAPMNDFVVETGSEAMGSNGIWYWAKWKSGKAECWGIRNYGNMAVTTAWGSLFRSEIFTQALPSGLFLIAPFVVDISLARGSYGGWIVTHEQSIPTATQTGSFIIVRPAAATISQAFLSFHVIGRWK